MNHQSDRNLRPFEVAGQIDALLSEVISLQRDFVLKCCPVCPEPCCKRVTELFDEKDLIFARVMGINGTPGRKRKRAKSGCPHLSETGCLLEPKARPFTCHRYLCETLKQAMNKEDAELVSRLEKTFRILEDLRGRLWGAYLEV